MDDPLTGYVRVKAICLFLHDGRLLAIDDFDPTKQQRFWVPVGGRVEFGETSRQAIIREIREELDAEVLDLELLGVLENLFTFDGDEGHEIVFIYDARFAETAMYGAGSLKGMEGDKQFEAHWIDANTPAHNQPLYPDGLLNLIGTDENHRLGQSAIRSYGC